MIRKTLLTVPEGVAIQGPNPFAQLLGHSRASALFSARKRALKYDTTCPAGSVAAVSITDVKQEGSFSFGTWPAGTYAIQYCGGAWNHEGTPIPDTDPVEYEATPDRWVVDKTPYGSIYGEFHYIYVDYNMHVGADVATFPKRLCATNNVFDQYQEPIFNYVNYANEAAAEAACAGMFVVIDHLGGDISMHFGDTSYGVPDYFNNVLGTTPPTFRLYNLGPPEVDPFGIELIPRPYGVYTNENASFTIILAAGSAAELQITLQATDTLTDPLSIGPFGGASWSPGWAGPGSDGNMGFFPVTRCGIVDMCHASFCWNNSGTSYTDVYDVSLQIADAAGNVIDTMTTTITPIWVMLLEGVADWDGVFGIANAQLVKFKVYNNGYKGRNVQSCRISATAGTKNGKVRSWITGEESDYFDSSLFAIGPSGVVWWEDNELIAMVLIEPDGGVEEVQFDLQIISTVDVWPVHHVSVSL